MSTILVTGATGFVGRALCERLLAQGHQVRAALRKQSSLPEGIEGVMLGPMEDASPEDWGRAVAGADAVVHLAARVHQMREDAADPMEIYRRANTAPAVALAEAAARAGVRRLVFMSSVKAAGEASPPGRPLTERDPPAPTDPYGISKLEAEEALLAIAAKSELEVCVLRPPLVYGPGVRANFLALLRLADKGLPLPLGAVRNKRSLVYLGNLVDAVVTVLTHPGAAGQRFYVTDGDDLSTAELVRAMAAALGRRAPLLPVPPALLKLGANLVRRPAIAQRLLGSLQLDSGALQRSCDWRPPYSVADGLRETVAGLRR